MFGVSSLAVIMQYILHDFQCYIFAIYLATDPNSHNSINVTASLLNGYSIWYIYPV